MTTSQVGKLLGVSRNMVYKYLQRGQLHGEMQKAGAGRITDWHNFTEQDIANFQAKMEKHVGKTGRVYWKEKGASIRRHEVKQLSLEEPTLEAKVDRLCQLLEALLETLGYKAA